jgi:hypothetical protein
VGKLSALEPSQWVWGGCQKKKAHITVLCLAGKELYFRNVPVKFCLWDTDAISSPRDRRLGVRIRVGLVTQNCLKGGHGCQGAKVTHSWKLFTTRDALACVVQRFNH